MTFLVGPGGVGKSTFGRLLSSRLRLPLIDLDAEFCSGIGLIGEFISTHGYERYRRENLALAQKLVGDAPRPGIFVTSSGFLAAAPESDDYREAHALVSSGYGIVVLPSLDIEKATEIVVDRQLARGFGLRREPEERKFKARFPVYLAQGDALVVSIAPPARICDVTTASIFSALG
jgi:shikimate kinase